MNKFLLKSVTFIFLFTLTSLGAPRLTLFSKYVYAAIPCGLPGEDPCPRPPRTPPSPPRICAPGYSLCGRNNTGCCKNTSGNTSCSPGWYACGSGMCCRGGGCPSNICGPCSSVWRAVGTRSFCDATGSWCNGQCSNATPPPPPRGGGGNYPVPAPIVGRIWEDVDNDNLLTGVDRYWGTPASASCTPNQSNTLKITENFSQNGTPLQAVWSCGSSLPMYTTSSQASGSNFTLTLTPPNNFACNFVTWNYTICRDSSCANKNQGGGTGCSASVPNIGSFGNHVWWKLQIPSRTVSGRIQEVSPDDLAMCSGIGDVPVNENQAKLYFDAAQVSMPQDLTAAGTFTFTGISATTLINKLCITGTLKSPTKTYRLGCAQSPQAKCTIGSGGCAVNCTPNNVLNGDNFALNLGFIGYGAERWFSVLDGDIYGESIETSVATNPLGNFSPNLINTRSVDSVGGYAFVGETITLENSATSASENGGTAERLSSLAEYPFEDEWLNKFNFNVPDWADSNVPADRNFIEGKVYSLTVDEMNALFDAGSYNVVGGNLGDPGLAIVYVTGVGTLNINKDFVNQDSKRILVLVTNVPIAVGAEFGITDVLTYNTSSPSQLDLGIISGADITFNSKYDEPTDSFDIPLVVNGFIVTRGQLALDRNLGFENNSVLPSVAIRKYPYIHNLLRKYEAELAKQDRTTGISVIDVQYSYSE